MDWKASPPAIEILAGAVAATVLGGAVAFAIAGLSPFGAGPLAASLAGGLVVVAAWQMVQRVDRQRGPGQRFVPEPLTGLLADETAAVPADADDADESALLLDDPIPAAGESRVVRLFAMPAEGSGGESTALAAPGDMVARIADFLDQGRGATGVTPLDLQRATTEDASAALHAALADIRRSLRQG